VQLRVFIYVYKAPLIFRELQASLFITSSRAVETLIIGARHDGSIVNILVKSYNGSLIVSILRGHGTSRGGQVVHFIFLRFFGGSNSLLSIRRSPIF
jgi:hypothetical protein